MPTFSRLRIGRSINLSTIELDFQVKGMMIFFIIDPKEYYRANMHREIERMEDAIWKLLARRDTNNQGRISEQQISGKTR